MSDERNSVENERQILLDAEAKGGLARIKTYSKLSGPGWLQSAITLGGGSLGGALFLGVIGGYGMLWVQLVAMILGVIMLSAISYVTLSTEESPFQGIKTKINPVLAWGWLIASMMANMVWVLPQYSLAFASISQNLMPGAFPADTADITNGHKMVVTIIIFVIVTAITFCYGTKGIGIKIYEWVLKIMVAFIVLCFFGVVIKLAGRLPWGEIARGFIPNFGVWNSPSPTFAVWLNQIADPVARAFWEGEVLGAQRSRMIAAASAAVGINMTFLLPYSMLAKKWGKEHRGLAIFDLSTGMVIPFVLAVSCVVIASAYSFHDNRYEDVPGKGVLVEDAAGNLIVNRESNRANAFNKLVAKRNGAAEGSHEATKMEVAEMEIAARLMKRDNMQLAPALKALTGSEAVANKIFGLGVLAMTMSTISLLMLISGFVFCEALRLPHTGWPLRFGTLFASTGLLWPFIWGGDSAAYLVVPTSTFGYMLLPIAFLTFFFMMNSKALLGENLPRGGKRVTWNVLMGVSLLITGYAAITTGWAKTMKIKDVEIPFGRYAIIIFVVLVIIGHFCHKRTGHKSSEA
ncbi:MAG: divalent metal cation transporter [Verrucomicrobiota bacterium]